EILTSIAQNTEKINNPLFTGSGEEGQVKDDQKNILLVLITSNRGLCGAYNAQVIKKALTILKDFHANASIKILNVGKKGNVAMQRVGQDVIASFTELPDNITLSDIAPISQLV